MTDEEEGVRDVMTLCLVWSFIVQALIVNYIPGPSQSSFTHTHTHANLAQI